MRGIICAAGIIFLGSILIGMYLLLGLAQSWPQLIRLWYRTEHIFLRKPYFVTGYTLKWRLRLVGFTVLAMALSIKISKYILKFILILFLSGTYVLHHLITLLVAQVQRDVPFKCNLNKTILYFGTSAFFRYNSLQLLVDCST